MSTTPFPMPSESAAAPSFSQEIATFNFFMDTLIFQLSRLIAIQQRRRREYINEMSDDEGIWLQRMVRRAGASFDLPRETIYAAIGDSAARKIVSGRYKELMKIVFGMGKDRNMFWEWFVGWRLGA